MQTNVENVPDYEVSALYELYIATNGMEWDWEKSDPALPGIPWNFTTGANPCNDGWQGISCTNTSSLHIAMVILPNMGLVGVLPESIAWLSELQLLVLSSNDLSGPIPNNIGNMTQLFGLDLGDNLLEGTIPASISQLNRLIEVGLGTNKLTGTLPALNNATDLLLIDISSNSLDGNVFASIDHLYLLEILAANNNLFSGSIPFSIGNLNKLHRLILDYNFLTGSLPESTGQLSELRRINIANNLINGTLPNAIGNWTQVQDFYAQTNKLTGSMPASLGNLTSLEILSLQTNALTGHIPPTLCNVTTLSALRVFTNGLTGPIPACLALNYNFSVFVAYQNQLTGTLPPEWAMGSKMNFFDINDNFVSGTIPASMGTLSEMGSLYMGSNKLVGTVPASLSQLSGMVYLYLSYNYLTGTIPKDIGQLSQLLYIEMSGNRMTGILPVSIGAMKQLLEIHLDTNSFQGHIPDSWMELPHLRVFNVYLNHLTGTIPSTLGQLVNLQFIGFDSNRLTGTLPVSIGACTILQSLQVQHNQLHGTLPVGLKSLAFLTSLLVQSNQFSGPVHELFAGATQIALSTIQLSNNMFTSSLPAEAFLAPNLLTFAAVSNCFTGSLPNTLCNNTALQVLALSGLQAASGCQERLLPSLSNAYVITKPLPGGIPQCVFEMTSLTTLQLSGNGLTGQLPSSINISASLVDLTLSHNSLTGKIPRSFQSRQWQTLDLSYNRFSGTLSSDLETRPTAQYTYSDANAALSLEGNRLSGDIPSTVQSMSNISILSGNLFTCNVEQTSLPQHDSARSNYECGSTTFEVPYYVWLAVACTIITCAFLARYWAAQLPFREQITNAVDHLQKWYFVLDLHKDLNPVKLELQNLRHVLNLYQRIARLALIVAAYCVLVLLPLYALMSRYYGTVTHQYAYTISAAFHSGTVPLGLEMTALLVLMVLFLVCFVMFWQRITAREAERIRSMRSNHSVDSVDSNASTPPVPVYSSLANRVTVYGCLLLTNFIVVAGCNVAYVYVALYETSELLLFAQILLSLYKLAWNKFCASSLIPWTARVLSTSVSNDLMISSVEFFPLQLFLALFNNIVIPCLVVAVVSPNCFSYLLTAAPSVDSHYVVDQCINFDDVNNVCKQYYKQTETTSFDPPFTYSYQCSASFITYYAPAYVIMCIMSTFGIPVLQYVLVWLHIRYQPYAVGESGYSRIYKVVDLVLPNLLKPAFSQEDREDKAMEERWTMVQRDIYSPHFPANQFLLNMLTYLGILLTFGAVFPPLAVALAVTVLGAAMYARLKVGRFLHVAIEEKQFKYLELINKECRGVGSTNMLQVTLFMQIITACCFYALFLFDTLGDAQGADKAFWVLILIPLMPIVLYTGYILYAVYFSPVVTPRGVSISEQSVGGSVKEVPMKELHSTENSTFNTLHANNEL